MNEEKERKESWRKKTWAYNWGRGGKDEGEEERDRNTQRETERRKKEREFEKRKWDMEKKCRWIFFPIRETEAAAVSNEEMESGWFERTISSKCSRERKWQKMKEKEGGETFSLMDRWSSEGGKKQQDYPRQAENEEQTFIHGIKLQQTSQVL